MPPDPRADEADAPLSDLPWHWLAPLAAVVATAVMVSVVFRHELRHDDLVHCYEAVHQPLWPYLWTPYGGHIVPLHRLAYAVLQPSFGLTALPYFLLTFVTHLATVVVLYRLLLRITRRVCWAAFWAGLWGTSLPCAATIIIFSTFGPTESGLLTLLVLNDLFSVAQRNEAPTPRRVGVWSVGMLLSALASGFGVALAFGTFVCAALVLRAPGARRAAALIGAAALAIFFFYRGFQESTGDRTTFDPSLLHVSIRAFLLFCARGLADLFLPIVFTVASGEDALGPLRSSSESTILTATAVVGVGLAIVLLFGARSLSPERRRAFRSLALIGLGNYALVALGRSATARGFGLSLEGFVQSARYHYLNTAFLTAAFAVGLSEWGSLERWLRQAWFRRSVAVWGAFVFVTSFVASRQVSATESELAREARRDLHERVRAAVLAARPGGRATLANDPYAAAGFIFAVGVPASRFPHSGAAWLCDNGGEVVASRSVRFEESDVALLRSIQAEPDSPAARVIVPVPLDVHVLASPSLTVGEASANAQVVRGVYDDVQGGYAWTAKEFAIVLEVTTALAERGGILKVMTYVPETVIAQSERVILRVRAGSSELPAATIQTAGLSDVEFAVAAGQLQPGRTTFEFALTERFAAPGDDRDLGILVRGFELLAR